ncbi:hypothetical protein Vadar_000935 [Vaccinium darrowii]|uniref:Uncharacterized protein n=1 Tax=Vaccinium darrowii TaxID=229202 RepID=A0ACB7XF18_9ERIC|nr:hypothetical protein Vadar_000935 [Vaccinium darrowii]
MFQIIILLLWLTATETVADHPAAKPGCQEKCGNIVIPYPFGIGPNCYISDSFEVTCNNSLDPPRPFIKSVNLEVLRISLENWTVQVNNPVITANCSGRANGREVNLTGTPFSYSAIYNRFTATGCNNLALITHQANIITGCMLICNINSSREASCYGINCCQTTIPHSLSFINASLGSLDPNSNQDSCKHAFMVDYHWFSDNNILAAGDMEYVPAVLDWRANIYLSSQCYCEKGYEGNPYLPGGCQDIDECSNSTLKHCEGICLNTPGG